MIMQCGHARRTAVISRRCRTGQREVRTFLKSLTFGETMEYFFPVLFLAVFILMGLAIIASAMDEVRKSLRSAKWPTTRGTITRSDIKVESDSESTSYLPDIEFEYTVGESNHRCTSVRVGRIALCERWEVSPFNKRYPVGKGVIVAYDPVDPGFAVLEPGLFRNSLTSIMFGSLFVHCPATMLFLYWLTQQ